MVVDAGLEYSRSGRGYVPGWTMFVRLNCDDRGSRWFNPLRARGTPAWRLSSAATQVNLMWKFNTTAHDGELFLWANAGTLPPATPATVVPGAFSLTETGGADLYRNVVNPGGFSVKRLVVVSQNAPTTGPPLEVITYECDGTRMLGCQILTTSIAAVAAGAVAPITALTAIDQQGTGFSTNDHDEINVMCPHEHNGDWLYIVDFPGLTENLRASPTLGRYNAEPININLRKYRRKPTIGGWPLVPKREL